MKVNKVWTAASETSFVFPLRRSASPADGVNQQIMRQCVIQHFAFFFQFQQYSTLISFLAPWCRSLSQLGRLEHRGVQSGTWPCLACGVARLTHCHCCSQWMRELHHWKLVLKNVCLLMDIKVALRGALGLLEAQLQRAEQRWRGKNKCFYFRKTVVQFNLKRRYFLFLSFADS